MSTQINTGLITSVLPLLVVKIEPPKPEIVEIGIDDILSASDEEIIPDVKVIDSVLPMKEAQFVKRANITLSDNLIKTEVTTDGNINKGTGQGLIEVQGNLNIREQLVLNFLDETHKKPKYHKKTDGNILWTSRKEDKENIKVIEAPVNPHVCNHCQHVCKKLKYLNIDIKEIHRDVTKMYQCPFCPFKSKWTIRCHIISKHNIIQKHKNTKDIQIFKYCCEKCTFITGTYAEFKLHEQSHKRKAEMDDRVLKYRCNKCKYKTFIQNDYKKHKLIHLKPEETQYFCCYHCSYKFNRKDNLRRHILRHYKNGQIQFHCYICNFMTRERELIIEHIKTPHSKVQFKTRTENQEERYCCEKCTFISTTYAELKLHEQAYKINAKRDDRYLKYRCNKCKYKTFRENNYKKHKLIHLKPEENQYFCCYHCSYKFNRKDNLQRHIFRHYKNGEIQINKKIKVKRDDRYLKYRCNKCKYKTFRHDNYKKHKLIHLKPEETQYFYCYHCSYKFNRKYSLQRHIFRHYKNGKIQINKKIKVERDDRYLKYRCNKCKYKTFRHNNFYAHKKIHLKPEEIQYFYCYHCSHKSKRKDHLRDHIFNHFKKEEVTFHCYICDFMAQKSELIIEHIKKHSKV